MKTNRLTNFEASDEAYALRVRRASVAEGKKFWEEELQIDSQPPHLRRMLTQQAAMYSKMKIDPMILHGHAMRRLDEFDWNKPASKAATPESIVSRFPWREPPHGEINPVTGLKVGIPDWLGRPD